MKKISTTYCRRFDNSCYHHQCIANGTAVILVQVLMVSQERNAVKKSYHLEETSSTIIGTRIIVWEPLI